MITSSGKAEKVDITYRCMLRKVYECEVSKAEIVALMTKIYEYEAVGLRKPWQ